jgi:hypothetical protein
MNFISLGDRNPLNHPDGQARVLNVVFEQLCLLRAEVGAIQGTLMMVGGKVGVSGEELVKTRIELRDDFFRRIQGDIMATLSGIPPSDPQSPA